MTACSEYLNQPAKPRPDHLPGDRRLMRGVAMTCSSVAWKRGRWVYYWAKEAAQGGNRRPGRPAVRGTAK